MDPVRIETRNGNVFELTVLTTLEDHQKSVCLGTIRAEKPIEGEDVIISAFQKLIDTALEANQPIENSFVQYPSRVTSFPTTLLDKIQGLTEITVLVFVSHVLYASFAVYEGIREYDECKRGKDLSIFKGQMTIGINEENFRRKTAEAAETTS